MLKKGEYAIVLDHQHDWYTARYIGQKVLVDEDDDVPYCICPDGNRVAFDQSELKPENTMKDFYVNVPNHEGLRKLVQDHAFSLYYAWGCSRKNYHTDWANDYICFGRYKKIWTCSEKHAKDHSYKKLSLRKFFELKPEECTDKVSVVCEGKEVWISRESAKALNLIDEE